MKSSKEQLERRGYLPPNFNADLYDLSYPKKIELLTSKIPKERTMAARCLTDEAATAKTISSLIKALKVETKLYPKIEISNTLVAYGEPTVPQLIKVLGEIGNNQHKKVPATAFKKKSYPLPRDIASRIIAHIGKIGLPQLTASLTTMNTKQLSEAIDAIGFICFYDNAQDVYIQLKKCYERYNNNELIKWKILRSFSAFSESKAFLESEKKAIQNIRLLAEIDRSLLLCC